MAHDGLGPPVGPFDGEWPGRMVKCPFTFLRGPHQRHSRILAEYGERSYNRRFHAPVVLDILLRGSSG